MWPQNIRVLYTTYTLECYHTHLCFVQNLDGGGSSVSVYNGKVISKPTCYDIHFICERSVSSIACMMGH